MPVVLITGSSRGLGNALTRRFADNGWDVAATMLDTLEAPELGNQANISKIELDVSKPVSITAGVQAAIERFGGIDLLINCAGYGVAAPVELASEDQIRRGYETNVLGPVFVTRAVIPHMRARRQGTILFITSAMGHCSAPLQSFYGSFKWATEGFAESLVYELKPFNIRVKACAPGAMATTFFNNTDDKLDGVPAEYARTVDLMKSGLAQSVEGAPNGDEVAAEVFKAATDGTDTFRYFVTEQSRQLIAHRRSVGDEAWLQGALAGFMEGNSVAHREA